MADVTMDGEGMYGTVEEGVSWGMYVVMMHSDGEGGVAITGDIDELKCQC